MIRKIEISTAIVTTLSGSTNSGFVEGAGTDARFSSPEGITTDGTYLYISDTGNHRVRSIVAETGLTSTFDVSGTVNADGTPYAGGNTNFADIYYSGNTAKLYYESINSEYALNVLCVAGVNEFTDSTNLTFTVGVDDPRITEIALYGENTTDPTKPGELLAYGKLDRPVEKGAGDVVSFLVQIKA